MTRTLDRLEAKNFITRQRCPDDRRVVRIALTEAGTKVAEQIMPAVAASLNAHSHGFRKAEVKTLIELLKRMLPNGTAGTVPVGCRELKTLFVPYIICTPIFKISKASIRRKC